MSDTSHRDLAAVLPYAEPVLVSPPLIPVWRAYGFIFPLCDLNLRRFHTEKDEKG